MTTENYEFNRYMADFRLWKDYDRILVWILSQPHIPAAMLQWMYARRDDYRSEL